MNVLLFDIFLFEHTRRKDFFQMNFPLWCDFTSTSNQARP